MTGKLLVALACCFCPMVMASDIGFTSTTLLSAISAEHSEKQQANFVFSPYSILAVFHMAQLGAEGETRKQMDSLVPPYESFKLPSFEVPLVDGHGVRLETANRIYAYEALEGNKHFVNFNKEIQLAMGGEARTVNFVQSEAAANEINEFVDKKTHGHIQKLIEPSSLSGATRMVLVNALYFKAPWSSKFAKGATVQGLFYARTREGHETQTVDFMRNLFDKDFTFLKEEGVTAFSLNYADYRLRMFVYVPDDVTAFELKIAQDPQYFVDLAARLEGAHLFDHQLALTLPRFKLSAERNRLDLVSLFKRLGADLMFDSGRADFSGMTGNPDLHVSSYVHQADIAVDEDGTEATAATAMGIMLTSMPAPKTTLRVVVDRPFLFQVRLVEQGSSPYVLFAGRIADAKAAQ